MKTVYKYDVAMNDTSAIQMPAGAELLHVDVQHGSPKLWALVDTEAPLELREFHMAGTGWPADGFGKHVGTFTLQGGALVFHLFERAQT